MNDEPLELLKKFVYWNDSIALADVMRLLSLGKTQSNKYFSLLKRDLKEHLKKRGHRYQIVRSTPFSFSVNNMLNELLMWKNASNNEKFYLETKNIFVDPLHSPVLNQASLKKVISALNNNQAIEISYVDAKVNAIEEKRIIKPLALCFINERWHIHSYCFKRNDSRDFVLSRIQAAGKPFNLRFSRLAATIQDMQQMTSISVSTHPGLSDDQRKVVEREYGLTDGIRKIEIPKHQLFYFRKKYIAEKNEGPPNKFLIENL